MIRAEKETILKDKMLQDLKIETTMEDNVIFQCKKPQTTITKYVYKTHNEVFCNRNNNIKPKCKCVFTLHTEKKSSFVQIYDRNGEKFFSGNSLWGDELSKNETKHLEFIKLLHSVENVIENYGGVIPPHKPQPTYNELN